MVLNEILPQIVVDKLFTQYRHQLQQVQMITIIKKKEQVIKNLNY